MPVQLNVLAAHYEISRANLTKSLLIFCCTGLIALCLGARSGVRYPVLNKTFREQRESTVAIRLLRALSEESVGPVAYSSTDIALSLPS